MQEKRIQIKCSLFVHTPLRMINKTTRTRFFSLLIFFFNNKKQHTLASVVFCLMSYSNSKTTKEKKNNYRRSRENEKEKQMSKKEKKTNDVIIRRDRNTYKMSQRYSFGRIQARAREKQTKQLNNTAHQTICTNSLEKISFQWRQMILPKRRSRRHCTKQQGKYI